jgi:proteasome lid subunit RPN8/RPN11
LLLSDSARKAIVEHAAVDYPHECCGALLGADTQYARQVSHVLPIRNTHEDNRRRRFRITPREYLEAEDGADELGLSLLGFYHSHPDHPAIPSEYDLTHALPFFSYVIVAVDKSVPTVITSWVLDDKTSFVEQLLD